MIDGTCRFARIPGNDPVKLCGPLALVGAWLHVLEYRVADRATATSHFEGMIALRAMRTGLAVAATAAAVVALAACGSKSSNGGNTTPATQPAPNTSSQPAGGGSTTPSSTGNALKACMVLDTG